MEKVELTCNVWGDGTCDRTTVEGAYATNLDDGSNLMTISFNNLSGYSCGTRCWLASGTMTAIGEIICRESYWNSDVVFS